MIITFIYLSDLFRAKDFQQSLRETINKTLGNNTSHSIINWVENKTNAIAAFTAFSSVTVLGSLPVIMLFLLDL
jgi:hypothetical protein